MSDTSIGAASALSHVNWIMTQGLFQRELDQLRNTIAIFGLSLASAAGAQVAFLNAAADNTLYHVNDGTVSNGSGGSFFAGTTLIGNSIRRGLIRFDLSGLPQDAQITTVRLTMHMSRSVSLSQPVSLHKASGSWGEGASNAPGEGGAGDVASEGDAHLF